MKELRIFMLKDVEKVGLAGEIVKVAEGHARNFLIPRKMGMEVTPQNEASLANRVKVREHKKEVLESNTSMLAERIRGTVVTLKRKLHDEGQLYGSISAKEIAEALSKQHSITVSNNQVLIDKTIKAKGTHSVTIKLSSKLQPKISVKVVAEKAQ